MSLPDFNPSNANDQWRRFCDLLWFHEDLGIWLDISRMNINQSDFEKINPSLDKAFEAISSLEAGSFSNIDEKRQVGHYWLRNSSLAPTDHIKAQIDTEVSRVELFGKKILNGEIRTSSGNKFTHVVWIGIGGSSLGPLLIVRALQEVGIGLNFIFMDNVDPDGINDIFRKISSNLETTLFVTVSKSGGTPEPRICMEQSKNRLEKEGLNWSNQSIAITMPNSDLDIQSKTDKWLDTFYIEDWVGGRTSITSPVGLLPCALIGVNINDFLEGASKMDLATRSINTINNPSALLAASWFFAGSGKGSKDMVVLPYKDRLEVFSRYLQQLVMESLGKSQTREGEVVHQGLAVYGNKGSTDQHAYVQQLRDGIDNFFAVFIEVLVDNSEILSVNNNNPGDFLSGFLQGTRTALSENGRQSITITIRDFNCKTLGAIVALLERTVGIYAELININAYNQPGVEAGKKAASKILNLQKNIEYILESGKSYTISELASEIETNNDESIFLILRHLQSNNKDYKIIGDWSEPHSLTISKD